MPIKKFVLKTMQTFLDRKHTKKYLIPLSHYSFSWQWNRNPPPPPPWSLHFIQVVHITGGQPLIRYRVLTVNNSRMIVQQTMVTERQPPLTLNSPWTTPLVTIVGNSYAHARNRNRLYMLTVPKSEAEILNNLKLL